MAETPDNFEDRLTSLKQSFVDGLPGRIDDINGVAAAIGKDPAAADSRRDIAALRELVHKLAGAGGTFGHLAVGDAAAWAERACDDILGRDAAPTADQWRQVEARLEKLRRAAADAVAAAGRKRA